MKNARNFLSHLPAFFLELEIFQTHHIEKINRHFMFNKCVRKSCRLWDNVDKYCRARQVTDDNKMRDIHFTCWNVRMQKHTQNMKYLLYFEDKNVCRSTDQYYILTYIAYPSCYISW